MILVCREEIQKYLYINWLVNVNWPETIDEKRVFCFKPSKIEAMNNCIVQLLWTVQHNILATPTIYFYIWLTYISIYEFLNDIRAKRVVPTCISDTIPYPRVLAILHLQIILQETRETLNITHRKSWLYGVLVKRNLNIRF